MVAVARDRGCWWLTVGLEVRLMSFGWGRKWKHKPISTISAFILWSTAKQFPVDQHFQSSQTPTNADNILGPGKGGVGRGWWLTIYENEFVEFLYTIKVLDHNIDDPILTWSNKRYNSQKNRLFWGILFGLRIIIKPQFPYSSVLDHSATIISFGDKPIVGPNPFKIFNY